MNEQQRELLKLLKLLYDNDCLDYLILIGSWAEFLYAETGVLPNYEAQIKTLDIDFLVKNLKRPMPSVNISALAKDEGYDIEVDRLTGVTKLLNRKGLEIEFLISQKGSGENAALKTNLGVTAQALRHLEMLKTNTVDVEYFDVKVTVPTPEAFVLHKMIINGERKEKTEKDRAVINRMYPHMDTDNFDALKELLTKKEKRAVEEYIIVNITPEIEKEEAIRRAKEHLKK